MLLRRFLLLLIIAGTCFSRLDAQTNDFCKAITAIIHDAPNKFRNVRGKTLDAGMNATFWDCSIKVPGTIGARFVASMGLYYEGAVFMSADLAKLKTVYEQYKNELSSCLAAQGYSISLSDNFYPGLAEYKKVIFMLDEKEDPTIVKPLSPPPHVTLEATYSKEVGKYTVVMFIFEH